MAGLIELIWTVGGLQGDPPSDVDAAIDAFLTANKVCERWFIPAFHVCQFPCIGDITLTSVCVCVCDY